MTFEELIDRNPFVLNSEWRITDNEKTYTGKVDMDGDILTPDNEYLTTQNFTKTGPSQYCVNLNGVHHCELISYTVSPAYWLVGDTSHYSEYYAYVHWLRSGLTRDVTTYWIDIQRREFQLVSFEFVPFDLLALIKPEGEISYHFAKAIMKQRGHYVITKQPIDLGELVTRKSFYGEHYLYRIDGDDCILARLIPDSVFIDWQGLTAHPYTL